MEDSRYNDLLGRIESLSKSYTELDERVTRYGEGMYDIPGLVERIEALDSWLTKLDADVKTRLGTLAVGLSDLGNEVHTHGEDLSYNVSARTKLEKRIEKLEQQSATGRDPVVALEDRMLQRWHEFDSRLNMYIGMLQTQQFLLDQYRQRSSELQRELAELRRQRRD